MKRKLQLLGLFAVLMLTALSQLSAQVITMTTTKKVGETIELRIDGEGEISIEGVKEAFQPSSPIFVTDRKRYTLTSQTIKIRGKVTELNCYKNRLSRLDVSACKALTELNCNSNQLSRLDVSACKALTELNCNFNLLSSLDVSGCTALTWLDCCINLLSSLDVSGCTALTKLNCRLNLLSSLDVSNSWGLTTLVCDGNELRSLNVSRTALKFLSVEKLPLLTSLDCSGTQLRSLDVSDCRALEKLYCYNNLLTELKGCTSKKLRDLRCYRNRINATAMWRIINDLNDEGGDKWLEVLEDREGNREANQLTKKQIYKAKSKGWTLEYGEDRGRVEANTDEVPEPTAIEGLDGVEAFACYPNPATDFVSLKGLEPQAEVEVYSMAGACVLRGKADASGSLDLDVRQLAEGLYLVKAASRTMKLEVKH